MDSPVLSWLPGGDWTVVLSPGGGSATWGDQRQAAVGFSATQLLIFGAILYLVTRG